MRRPLSRADAREWVSLRTSGSPNGGDMALEVLVRGSRAWMKSGSGWESMPAPTGAGSSGTLSGAAFQQLARYVKDVRVTEHQLIQGKSVTATSAPCSRSTSGRSCSTPRSSPSGSWPRVGILAEGKNIEVDLRYRLASANEPVQLPSPHG
jgi:hypothetical protein